jgi:hypothetical protein
MISDVESPIYKKLSHIKFTHWITWVEQHMESSSQTQNYLKLFHYTRIIGVEAHASCVIKIILEEIVCSNICADIIHHIFCITDSSEIKKFGFSWFFSSCIQCWTNWLPIKNFIEFDLNFAKTFIVDKIWVKCIGIVEE